MASKSKTEDNSTKPAQTLDTSGQLNIQPGAVPYDYKDMPYTDDITEGEVREQAANAGVDVQNSVAFNDFRNDYLRRHANPEYVQDTGDQPDYLERRGNGYPGALKEYNGDEPEQNIEYVGSDGKPMTKVPYGGETPESPDSTPADYDTMLDAISSLSQEFVRVVQALERFSRQHDELTARDDAVVDEFRLKFEDIKARLERIGGASVADRFAVADVHGGRVDMSSIDKLPRVS